jgi:hypothetical protein
VPLAIEVEAIAPIALSMVKLTAFAVVHESTVVPPPIGSVVGFALRVQASTGVTGPVVTVTTAVQGAVAPLALVAVPVYVVVVVIVGAVVEPTATGVTAPMALSIEKVTALVVVHESSGAPLPTKLVGVAVSVHAGVPGGGGGVMVTAAVQVAVPPRPVTVPTYVVLVEITGARMEPPGETGVTAPIALSMENPVALFVVQVSVGAVLVPTNAVGDATSVHVGAGLVGGGVTVTVAWQTVSPPGPSAVMV